MGNLKRKWAKVEGRREAEGGTRNNEEERRRRKKKEGEERKRGKGLRSKCKCNTLSNAAPAAPISTNPAAATADVATDLGENLKSLMGPPSATFLLAASDEAGR